MGKAIIRTAKASDCEALAQLRCTYVTNQYQGYLLPELGEQNHPEAYLPRFLEAVNQPTRVLEVLEMSGKLCGYVLYGPDTDAEGWGLLVEAICLTDSEHLQLLIQYALKSLAAMGYPQVHVWAMHDNFRLRYLYEQCGFRRDGTQRTQSCSDGQLFFMRYQYTRQA